MPVAAASRGARECNGCHRNFHGCPSGEKKGERHRLNALNATLQRKLQRSEAALHAALACSATFRYGRTLLTQDRGCTLGCRM